MDIRRKEGWEDREGRKERESRELKKTLRDKV